MDTYRLRLNPYEETLIRKALIRERKKGGNEFVWSFGNADDVVAALDQYSVRGQVVKFYKGDTFIGILFFDVGSIWWCGERIIVENLVLCVDESYHGFQRDAIKQLEWLAKVYGAKAIVAGCYFQQKPQIVINGYKKAGFNLEAPSVMKVVDAQ